MHGNPAGTKTKLSRRDSIEVRQATASFASKTRDGSGGAEPC